MKINYSVKQLAKLAGVSVRTLHLYDQLGLLKPCTRTVSRYREYGEKELLRLQQILFYKELDFQLKEIGPILDDPGFDLIRALEGHRVALDLRKKRLDTLLHTVDKTITNLKNKTMQNYEELYEGMPKEQIAAIRKEAIDRWGEDNVLKSEKALIDMSEQALEQLKADQKDIKNQLKFKFLAGESTENEMVQEQIERHYHNIRGFWGLTGTDAITAAHYKGLATTYASDERYMAENGKPDPAFAAFLRNAMIFFADTRLK